MMRRSISVVLATSLLTIGVGQAVMAQSAPAGADQDLVRVEVPEAGIALSFTSDVDAEVLMERENIELPPELAEPEPSYAWTVVVGLDEDGYGCMVTMYEAHPLSIEEHVDWIEQGFTEDPELDGAAALDLEAVTPGIATSP